MTSARIDRSPFTDALREEEEGRRNTLRSQNTLHKSISGEYAPPIINATLINHLQTVFPPHVHKDFSLRDYDRMVGQQEVILYLEEQRRLQEEEQE